MQTIFILTNKWRREDDGGTILIGAYSSRELAEVRLAQEKAECLLEPVYANLNDDDYCTTIETDEPSVFTIQRNDYEYFDTYEITETPIDELKAA